MNIRKPKKFYARVWFWLLLLFVVPCGLLVILWISSTNRLNQRLAELRSQGIPASANDVDDFYQIPDGVADSTGLWMDALQASEGLESLDIDQQMVLPFIGNGATPVPLPEETWEQLDAARAFLLQIESQMATIKTAADAGGAARLPADFSLGLTVDLVWTQEARHLSRLLQLDTCVSLHDGKPEQAFQNLLYMFAVSDMLQAEPSLVSQLIRIATFTIGCDFSGMLLPHGPWSDAQLVALQDAAAQADFLKESQQTLYGERALCLSAMEMLPSTVLQVSNKNKALDLFEIAVGDVHSTWPAALKAGSSVMSEMDTLSGSSFTKISNMGVLMMFPAIDASIEAGARAAARQRCLIASIAARRFQLQHGNLPTTLDDLKSLLPGDDPALLNDPFTGQPLLFRFQDNSSLIYSVGRDLQDDGGDVTSSEDSAAPADVGFLITY